MKPKQWITVVVVALPILSWAFFRFIHYPVERERHNNGDYVLVAYEEPSSFSLSPPLFLIQCLLDSGLVFGYIDGNTQVRVDLLRGGERIGSEIMITHADWYQDHLPLSVAWRDDCVIVTEAQLGIMKTISFQPGL